MKKTIYLLRHGEVEERFKKRFRGRLDCGLSPRGEEMSDANVAYLKAQGVERVITTGKRRTDYVGEKLLSLGIPHEVDPRFQEAHFGAWEGKSWVEVESTYPAEVKIYKSDISRLTFPEGEAIADLNKRLWEAWQEILKQEFRRIAIVGHSTANTCLMARLQNKRFEQIPLQVIGSLHEIEVEETKISVLRHNVILYRQD
jgi:broad specificity phosphatase PhoE